MDSCLALWYAPDHQIFSTTRDAPALSFLVEQIRGQTGVKVSRRGTGGSKRVRQQVAPYSLSGEERWTFTVRFQRGEANNHGKGAERRLDQEALHYRVGG